MMAACSTENAVEEKQGEVENVIVKVDESKGSADCLDSKMTIWFSTFNKFQQEGMTMEEADKKANEAADKVYNDCLTGSLKLAEDRSAEND
jgi:hypothetical protein